ncbi:hypothetical protein L6164_007928 [Bauhinia variegata]|uniref:Uncharacterized protein n=1 Tax=Bauhinia variegata TaxID=167791 RepID=A0ACB9PGI9_BAUVA|nr:hypothetical protein L6164_007928 [Bauhinia variegata]
MDISVLPWRLFRVEIRVLILVLMLISAIVVFQCFASLTSATYSQLHALGASVAPAVAIAIPAAMRMDAFKSTIANGAANVTYEKELESDGNRNSIKGLIFQKREPHDESFRVENHEDTIYGFTREIDHSSKVLYGPPEAHSSIVLGNIQGQAHNVGIQFVSQGISSNSIENSDADLSRSGLLITGSISSMGSGKQSTRIQPENGKSELLKTSPTTGREWQRLTWITQMNSLLLQSVNSSASMRPRWSSPRDRELLSAKLQIKNAPVVSSAVGLYAPVFQDVSKFTRSYEQMERKLKVYVYREGEKPIFHQPKIRGIYASEGWFMKLMEGNKRFVVRDPRKAHLFYLPFSSNLLRVTLSGQHFGANQTEQYLKKYVELIAGKYRFWNRTGGADHFLVACHDWAYKITRQVMKSCIRAICNANVAKGFEIGKDTTLPVTYIRSSEDPLRGLGGKSPSERHILAFFAGSMHGYFRPKLLKHWENKEPDMKIFGPMPRDEEGKRMYREYMQSSKYCICARGYEVHTPRIVEAILAECVPVIISDNYVPPFFEVLKWEAFSVFVQERKVYNLRNILLSIPQDQYLALQLGVQKVQQHFLWHKTPVKYDLFHMILHSVWYNRISQIRSK